MPHPQIVFPASRDLRHPNIEPALVAIQTSRGTDVATGDFSSARLTIDAAFSPEERACGRSCGVGVYATSNCITVECPAGEAECVMHIARFVVDRLHAAPSSPPHQMRFRF